MGEHSLRYGSEAVQGGAQRGIRAARQKRVIRREGCIEMAPTVVAFYYDWYGNPEWSGAWQHWDE
ncbi:MAG: hypothetical protein M1298_04590, partial [Chloroflexi bacterium]|nr:hypothetical protein [Chloroflexota bacterium]